MGDDLHLPPVSVQRVVPDRPVVVRVDQPGGIYWCKDREGLIIEHVTTAYEGHRGREPTGTS